MTDQEIEKIRHQLEIEVGCRTGKEGTTDESLERLLDRTDPAG